MVLGLWVASRTEILPGLGAYNPASFEDMIEDLVRLAQGGSPQAILMARRFRSCLLVLFIVYPLVVVPPFLLVPPLLRRHRRLALVPLRPQTCWGGLALWAAVLALWGGLFLPGQLQRLATPSPVNPMLRPPFQLPQEEDGPEEP
jgi:hypothetical protein